MLRRKRALHGLGQDIRDHIERETQDNIDKGMAPDEARRQAMIKFGSVALAIEDTRAVWGWPSLDAIGQDLRYVLRALRRNPAFTAVVVLTLGFGIGLNTATFSIVNAALIRPLGFADPERLVALHERFGGQDSPFSPADFLDLEREQQSFAAVAAYLNLSFELSGLSEPVRIDGAKVSANLFSLLGAAPLLGRDFSPEEDRPGMNVAVLSWGLWQSSFGGDRSIVGHTVTLDRRPYTVIGVMPAAFEFPRRGPQSNNKPASIWVPLAFTDAQRQARGNGFNHGVVGRLKRGVSIERARAQLDVLARRSTPTTRPNCRKGASPRSACRLCRFETRSSAGWHGLCCCSWARSASCSWSRAPMSRPSCSAGPLRARVKSPSGPRSAQAALAWCSCCSPRLRPSPSRAV